MAVNLQLKNSVLRATKAPNLPIAPVDYSQQYVDQLTNALRLYFAEIDNLSSGVTNPLNGPTANRPVESVQLPLPIGSNYFDTTLGIPIWYDGTNWVNALGVVV